MIKIDVKGAIIADDDKWIYDMMDMPSTSPSDISSILEKNEGEDIQLIVNSGGGDVFSASEIYTTLRSHEGKVEAKVLGVAASAATVITSAATNVAMSPTASYMIHKASTVSFGNSDDFKHASDFLDTVDKSICTAYEHKTGMSQEDILNLMQKETWMSAESAKEHGFVDEVMFDEVKAVANATGALPDNVINLLKNQQQDTSITINDIKTVVAEMKDDIIKELENKKDKPKNNWLF